MTAHTCAGTREFLGKERTGGWHRCRSHLYGCVRAAGKEEDVAGGNQRHAFAYVFAGNGSLAKRFRTPPLPTSRWAGQTPSLPLSGQPFTGAVLTAATN